MKKLFIFAIAAILLMVFTTPVMAKFNIGAVIQTDMYWWEQSAENKVGAVLMGTNPGDGDLSTMNIDMPSWSRFNITWTNEKDVRARFEVAAGGLTGAAGGAGINMRHMYGEWQATPNFELMAGWSTTPFSPLSPPQSLGTSSGLHIILLGFGEFYSGRFPQVRGTYKFSDNCRLAVALLDPVIMGNPGFAASATPPAPVTGVSVVDNESTIPRIDVGLPTYIGPLKLYPSFFWHQQKYDNVGVMQDNDLTSWGVSLGFVYGIGPLTISGELNFGENWAATQSTVAALYSFAPYVLASGGVSDTEEMAFWIDFALKLGPVTPHFLYGSADGDNEGMAGAGDDMERRTHAYVLGVTIPVAKTFMISPEIGFYDFDDDASFGTGGLNQPFDMGDHTIIGVRFLVVF